jgi:hypothetical protein
MEKTQKRCTQTNEVRFLRVKCNGLSHVLFEPLLCFRKLLSMAILRNVEFMTKQTPYPCKPFNLLLRNMQKVNDLVLYKFIIILLDPINQ